LIELRPLELAHSPALWQAGCDPELWQLQPRPISSEAEMQGYVKAALQDASQGKALPYVVWHQGVQRVIGCTRFFDIAAEHARAEIGATWYQAEFHRTGVNQEAKLLMLAHAFEHLNFNKIVLKTEVLNTASRRAIEALGASQEGIFQQQFRSDAGRWRDMVYYAIFQRDWPACKQRLHERLANRQRA
jgi:N-acetyltransferase